MKNLIYIISILFLSCAEEAAEFEIEDSEYDTTYFEDYNEYLEWKEQHNLVPPTGCENSIYFADPLLEREIRLIISKPEGDIRYNDVYDISSLELTGGYNTYESLIGIHCLAGLTSLSIDAGGIYDITEVGMLEHLMKFEIRDNLVDDISPLEYCKELKEVEIYTDYIDDISPLVNNEEFSYEDKLIFKSTIVECNNNQYMLDLETLESRGVELNVTCQ